MTAPLYDDVSLYLNSIKRYIILYCFVPSFLCDWQEHVVSLTQKKTCQQIIKGSGHITTIASLRIVLHFFTTGITSDQKTDR